MTTKNFITVVIAACGVGVTNVAVCASAYNTQGKLEHQLPYVIIGGFQASSFFCLLIGFFPIKPPKHPKNDDRETRHNASKNQTTRQRKELIL
jgi:hypothetical protein